LIIHKYGGINIEIVNSNKMRLVIAFYIKDRGCIEKAIKKEKAYKGKPTSEIYQIGPGYYGFTYNTRKKSMIEVHTLRQILTCVSGST